MRKGSIELGRPSGRRTIFKVHHWPRRDPAHGYVCSSNCNHDDVYMFSNKWCEPEDESEIKKRLGKDEGQTRGRVLYYVARPALSSQGSLQREAAALVSFQPNAIQVYRVCMREDLIQEDRIFAFFYLCEAAYRLAVKADKPAQIYLEPGMDSARIEARLRNFRFAPRRCLTRRQRESVGSWLQRDP
jgi:hypothetical protein